MDSRESSGKKEKVSFESAFQEALQMVRMAREEHQPVLDHLRDDIAKNQFSYQKIAVLLHREIEGRMIDEESLLSLLGNLARALDALFDQLEEVAPAAALALKHDEIYQRIDKTIDERVESAKKPLNYVV